MTKRKFRATISTEKLVWDTFVVWAKQQNKSASELLSQYMKTAVSNEEYVADLHQQQENLESLLTKLIDKRLEARKESKQDQDANLLPKDPNLLHIGSFIKENLDGTPLGSSPGTFRFSTLTTVCKVNGEESEELITSNSKKYNIHWQSHNDKAAQSCLVEEIPRDDSTSIRKEQSNESHKKVSNRTLSSSLDLEQDSIDKASQSKINTDGIDCHDIVPKTDDPESSGKKFDTDDTDCHENMSDTDSTDDTDKKSSLRNDSFGEPLTDSELKSLENLSQAKSTITRWRSGRCKMPQFIKEKYEVVGTRWKLKT